jgi:M6 family metalloprotease-like protein
VAAALPTLRGDEDATKYKSVDIANPVATSVVDTTKTDGYKYGRGIFDKYLHQQYEYQYSLSNDFGQGAIPSRGESKILVVPVLFSDTTKTAEQRDAMRQECYKAFFGDADADTGWQSVRSYYYQSSYHQLYLEGSVSPTITLPKNFSYYESIYKGGKALPTNTIVEIAYKALFKGTNPLYNLADYDSNGDGVIDSIYMINEAAITDGFGWAYTAWHSNSLTSYPIGTYSWSSINFATKRSGYSFDKPDSHTYIHESGHLLGLDDYYDSYNSNRSPAGGPTMQDYNICDHDSFSKYLWGWTSPTVITDQNTETSVEVTLKPFESSGDCVVLGGKYNGTSLDEYLMIDYYTPTGLNQKDAETKYETLQGFDQAGIRIWHVDKRIYGCYLKVEGSGTQAKTNSYFDPNESTDGNLDNLGKGIKDSAGTHDVDYYATFSTNSSKNQSTDAFYINDELTLMRKSGGSADLFAKNATNADLFVAGDTFGTSTDGFANFKFNSTVNTLDYNISVEDYYKEAKVTLPYTIKVDTVGDTAKLTFTKVA